MSLTQEKLTQAEGLVSQSGAAAWLVFVRETAGNSDPILPLIVEGGLTWQSAFIVGSNGKTAAVIGNFDADPLVASGDWDQVVPYVQSIREPLLEALDLCAGSGDTLALNFSVNDDKADGLAHGMFLLLQEYLAGTRFAGNFVSAERICSSLRGIKTPTEIELIRGAISETERMFKEISEFARVGISERSVYRFVHELAAERNLGFSWDPEGDPIVNSGPNSMVGHGIPSDTILIEPGHVFHVDLGLVKDSYSSDMQRSWFVGNESDTAIHEDVLRAFRVVNECIDCGAEVLRPGVCGWEVDHAARNHMVRCGYPEYMHAFGHQVGRMAHDGGAILGPRWQRYGESPTTPIQAGEVYTLELGIEIPGRGYLGIEEMVQVTNGGILWLTNRQSEIWML